MNSSMLQSRPGARVSQTRVDLASSQPQRQVAFQRLEDRQFLAMERAFTGHGGWASGDELARRLRTHFDQPLSTLARWIVGRTIVQIEWQGNTLIPLFQFDMSDMSLQSTVAHLVAELVPVFGDWDLALWFAEPNSWLRDMAPVDVLQTHPLEVVHAARADRFVARG